MAIGLVASFYSQMDNFYGRMTYPYQGIGIVLAVAGIVFVAVHSKLVQPKKGMVGLRE